MFIIPSRLCLTILLDSIYDNIYERLKFDSVHDYSHLIERENVFNHESYVIAFYPRNSTSYRRHTVNVQYGVYKYRYIIKEKHIPISINVPSLSDLDLL